MITGSLNSTAADTMADSAAQQRTSHTQAGIEQESYAINAHFDSADMFPRISTTSNKDTSTDVSVADEGLGVDHFAIRIRVSFSSSTS